MVIKLINHSLTTMFPFDSLALNEGNRKQLRFIKKTLQ